MYFFIDSMDRSVTAYKTNGKAASAVIEKLGGEQSGGGTGRSDGGDHVRLAFELLGDRGVIVNVSQAFECIADSDDQAAQELAAQMKQAVDKFYA